MPNGASAHVFVPPEEAARPGRKVTAAKPPEMPWEASEQLPPGGLPVTAARGLRRLGWPGKLPSLGRLVWVPVPLLAPVPPALMLHTQRDPESGLLLLAPGPVRLKAVVQEVVRVEELRVPIDESTLKRHRRRSAEAAGGRVPLGVGRQQAGGQRPGTAGRGVAGQGTGVGQVGRGVGGAAAAATARSAAGGRPAGSAAAGDRRPDSEGVRRK